jgi:hypothetical protein
MKTIKNVLSFIDKNIILIGMVSICLLVVALFTQVAIENDNVVSYFIAGTFCMFALVLTIIELKD